MVQDNIASEKHKKAHSKIEFAMDSINKTIERFLAKPNRLVDEQRVAYALSVFAAYLNEDTMGELLPKMIVNQYTHRIVEEDLEYRGTAE